MGEFVQLHLHSEFSLLDGACRIEDIPKIARQNGHDAVAITDHGVMYGVPSFCNACRKEGIKPIIGCEVYVAPGSRFDRIKLDNAVGYHLILLVKNEIGYKNLTYLVTKAFTEGFYSKPRIDLELLASHHEGLIALSGCIAGYIPRRLLSGDFEGAKSHALEMYSLFGKDNYYLEIQDHGMAEEAKVRENLLRLHRETGIGLVATGDVHYISKSDAETQAILMCIQTGNVITDGRPIGFETDEYYYKSTEEMKASFSAYEGAIENTVKIADLCNFEFSYGKYYLPSFTPPDGQTPKEYLRQKTYEGYNRRLSGGELAFDKADEKTYIDRIEYELSTIHSMGFDDYYLIVRDFVSYALSQNIPVGPGRGSGAGSLVAYLNGITDVDPIRYDLLFERFLNPERVSMPDFDIDFCYNRRDEVIEYVKSRYGEARVSQIIAFATLAARAAVRDVGKALGMSYSEVDEVAALIPRDPGANIKDMISGNAKFKRKGQAREYEERFKAAYESDPIKRKLINTAAALEGMPRHSQVHAAGVVITDKPVCEYVPLSLSRGAVVTQYDMDSISALGLVKFDFLALRFLTIISDAEKLIQKKLPDFSIKNIPLDDEETYKFISAGNTCGLFQLESAGMKRLLTQLEPHCIEDITAAISLYRPGPMDSIPEYLKNRKSPDSITYTIPELKPILDVTYGCIIYQEQVMQICRSVAGYSLGRADIVRRMMAKKKTAEMEKERGIFVKKAAENRIDPQAADALFDRLVSFASYAFNKSHAVAYSILAYRTAYLKCRFCPEYTAALLTSVLGDIGKTAEYVADAAKFRVRILPPDINESYTDFSVSDGNIRFGLAAIKNVGPGFIDNIIKERENGKFTSFESFVKRMSRLELNKRQVEALIKCGAFDSFGIYRSRLIAACDNLIDEALSGSRSNPEGQLDIFSMTQLDSLKGAAFEFPDIPEFELKDLLKYEKESSGLFFSGHILDAYSEHIKKLGTLHISELYITEDEGETEALTTLGGYVDGDEVSVAGIITSKTSKTTRNGSHMLFCTLEDMSGEIELIVFPKLLEKYAYIFTVQTAIAVRGKLSLRENDPSKLIVNEVLILAKNTDSADNTDRLRLFGEEPAEPAAVSAKKPGIAAPKPKRIYIRLDKENTKLLEKVKLLISIFDGPTPVIIYDEPRKQYDTSLKLSSDAGDYLIAELKTLLGDANVVYK